MPAPKLPGGAKLSILFGGVNRKTHLLQGSGYFTEPDPDPPDPDPDPTLESCLANGQWSIGGSHDDYGNGPFAWPISRKSNAGAPTSAFIRAFTSSGLSDWAMALHASLTGTARFGFGTSPLTNQDTKLGDGATLGWDTNGNVYYNGAVVATYATYGAGDSIQFAIDFTLDKVWMALEGVWQDGDPDTGAGGLDGYLSGAVHAGAWFSDVDAGTQATAQMASGVATNPGFIPPNCSGVGGERDTETTYRYWRWQEIVSGGNQGITVSELLMLSDATTVETPTTITSSVPPNPVGPTGYDQLTDDALNAGTFWSQDDLPALTITYDFGVSVAITHIKQGHIDSAENLIHGAKLYGSNDNVTYEPVSYFQGATYAGDEVLGPAITLLEYVEPVPAEHTYRYFEFRDIVLAASPTLEFSELEIVNDDVRRVATISSSHAPSLGPLTRLTDNDLNTHCNWISYPAELTIRLDLGASLLCDGWKQGGYDSGARHIRDCSIYGSDDAVSWTLVADVYGVYYPGDFTLSDSQIFT